MSKHEAPQDGESGQPIAQRRPSPAPQRPSPSPRPSPTSRARRAAVGAGLDPALHRPSPRPQLPRQPHPEARLQEAPAAASLALGDRRAEDASSSATAGAGRAGFLDGTPAPISDAPNSDAELAAAPRGVSRALVAVLLVLIVALGATAWWLARSRGQAGSATERDRALSTAKSAAPVILSYNYRQLDKDIAAGRGRLTGRASTDYVQAMTRTIKPAAAKTHAVVQAQTDGAGVESVSADGKQVTVLVFGEQKVTNTSLSQPRTDLFRLRLTLSLVGKRWLVSKLDPI